MNPGVSLIRTVSPEMQYQCAIFAWVAQTIKYVSLIRFRISSAFSPLPFIRTFETVVDRLITIRKDLQQRTEKMEKSVRQAEREFSTRMKGLNDNFEVSSS